jgi:RNA polymerase sigma-70 factor, ECF subfamily
MELEDVALESDDAQFDPDLIERIPDAVSALPPASQLVVRMHYIDGLSHTEIAEALELSVGTVKSRLSYGLAALRTKIK